MPTLHLPRWCFLPAVVPFLCPCTRASRAKVRAPPSQLNTQAYEHHEITSNIIIMKNDAKYTVFKGLLVFWACQHNCSILETLLPWWWEQEITAVRISYSLEYCSSELAIRHNSYLQDVKFAAVGVFMMLFYRIKKVAYVKISQTIPKNYWKRLPRWQKGRNTLNNPLRDSNTVICPLHPSQIVRAGWVRHFLILFTAMKWIFCPDLARTTDRSWSQIPISVLATSSPSSDNLIRKCATLSPVKKLGMASN